MKTINKINELKEGDLIIADMPGFLMNEKMKIIKISSYGTILAESTDGSGDSAELAIETNNIRLV